MFLNNRIFTHRILLLTCTILATLQIIRAAPAESNLNPERDNMLYVTATAHLDDQWNWTIQDTINSYLPKTLHQNFELFKKYPHYVFSFEEAWRYGLMKEYYRDDFLTLSNYIASGRWRITGSTLVAGDVNIPSPESLIRQTLYANEYWQRTFDKTSVDLYLPDCFGFSYALPSIAAHCGLKGFSTQKLTWGSAEPVPFQNIGRWIGPDGASVVAVLEPGSYSSKITDNLANDTTYFSRITNMFATSGLRIDYRYFGTGDTGGSPDENSVAHLEQSVTTSNGLIHVLSTGADQIFRDLTPAEVDQLPTYRGELLLKTHGTGCYTAHPENKRFNRENEQRADAAERAAVIADWLQGGGTYPREELTEAWKRFLWHQFHDDLTGTSIPEAYQFSWNDYLLSLNQFGAVERNGIGILAQAMDTRVRGVPLVVYNPLSIQREDVVKASVTFAKGIPAAVRVFDSRGREVPSQMGEPIRNSVPVTFLANVPSVGAAIFDVRPASVPCELKTGLSVSASRLENSRYLVKLNSDGDVTSIFDKRNGREFLNAPIRWDFLDDRSFRWPAWELEYTNVVAPPRAHLHGPATFQVLENGPARVCLAITRAGDGSTFTERISLAAGDAGDRVDWDVSANWATRATLAKIEFPLAVQNSKATFDLGLGTIQRSNDKTNLYEFPAQQWADLTDAGGSYGVSILNDCKYGWDKPDDRTLRLTIFHTPEVGGSYPYQATNGFGTHRFGFAVMGHAKDWRAGASPWVAARFNQPLQAFQIDRHNGSSGKHFSFLSCDNPNVMVKAIKLAESGSEMIVRLQELSGSRQTAELTCAAPITAASEMTGTEQALRELQPRRGELKISVGGYAPLTLALKLDAPRTLVAKPESAPVPLAYSLDGISSDQNRTDGDFADGFTYPAELLPETITRDGIQFQLGPKQDGAANVLACRGQEIPLQPGYDRLFILASAASKNAAGAFNMGGQTTNLAVRYFTGFFGQWEPPTVPQDEVAWICTHRHTAAGTNDAYCFCYLFKYQLSTPPGAKSVVLPHAPDIRIFAMTQARRMPSTAIPEGGALGRNLLPWADAGPDQIINAAANRIGSVLLDASGSKDPDGAIARYEWKRDGRCIATTERARVELPVGTNTVWLTVEDNQGGTGDAQMRIVVLPPLALRVRAEVMGTNSAPTKVLFHARAETIPIPEYNTTSEHRGTTTAAGDNPPDEIAANVFDDTPSTKWLDFATNYPASRATWCQYQYADGLRYVVTNYALVSANDYPIRDPAAWALLGSNDGGAHWTVLDERTNETFSARLQTRHFSIAQPGAYNIYRLRVDRVGDPATANSMQLSEVELLGIPLCLYHWNFGDGTTAFTASAGESSCEHSYSHPGQYTVTVAVSYTGYTGTNSTRVTIGATETKANP